jgi:hypothetical protein
MSNTLTACIEFSFKGEDFRYAAPLDLDALLLQYDQFPAIAPLLAKIHHVDTYSYLYEVMAESDVTFSDAQGIAAEFVHGGEFDAQELAAQWAELKVLIPLQKIAQQTMGIADLKAHPDLLFALKLAYQQGQKA